MTDTRQLEGQCLCGAVTVRTAPPAPHVEACHCGMCRRWGGGPFLSLPQDPEPAFEGEEHIVRYASSDWAERGFCKTCGTHLFYFFRPKRGYSFPAGLFAAADDFDFTEEIFIDAKPGYYDFGGDRERLTAAEVVAKFGGATDD